MNQVFVDTSDFVAILNKHDALHGKALSVESKIRDVRKVTTEFVLIEVLNYFSEYRFDIKEYVANSVRRLIDENKIEIVLCSSMRFMDGFTLYSSRLDKGYSLTDCISMNVMREFGITDILTNDDHFVQEGFSVLL